MISHQNGLLSTSATVATPESEVLRERERLRRELLERIVNRETRRQATRGAAR